MKAISLKEKYRAYLQSKDWKKKRAAKLRCGKRQSCAFCGAVKGLEVHHLIYRRWYDVKTGDLRLVCRRCHDLIHQLINSGDLNYQGRRPEVIFAMTQRALKRRGIVWREQSVSAPVMRVDVDQDDTIELLKWYNDHAV